MLIIFLPGCIPYVVPPLDIAVGLDPVPLPSESGAAWPGGGELRIGVAPLSLLDVGVARRVDASAGLVLDWPQPALGGALDLGGYGRVAWRHPTVSERGLFWALEPRATVDVLARGVGDPEGVFSRVLVGLSLRGGGSCPHPDGSVCTEDLSVFLGEWSGAISLDGGVALGRGPAQPVVALSVEVRLPMGAGWVPLW